MRILVTGVAGLIGSSFSRYLMEQTDHDVLGVDDLSCGLQSNIPEGLPWRLMRIEDHDSCDELFGEYQPHIVYHFAAYAAECLSPFIRCFNYRNNTVATAAVVNACIRYRVHRLVFTSSMAVYGRGVPPFTEDDPCHPIDPYGVAKLASELDIEIAGEQHKLDWCILRPHNVYGPGQICTQKYRNVFGIWMHRYLSGLPLLVYGDGQQTRAFSYVEDILPSLLCAGVSAAARGQIINLGGTAPVTILEAAQTLCDVMGGGDIGFEAGRHEVKQAYCTTQKSRNLLGYYDATNLRYGLEEMWHWASEADHQDTWLPSLEVEEGLPSYWRADSKSTA